MSDLGKAALARRLYLHVLNGGKVTPDDMSRLVARIEELEAQLAKARNDALEEAANLAWSETEDSDWNLWSDDGYTAAAETVSREIHAAIRALKSTTQP